MQANIRISFDIGELTRQAKEIAGLFQVFENVPPDLCAELEVMLSDVVLGDCSTAIGADGAHELIQRLRFGDTFERLRAAVLARESGIVSHPG
jgi:hypothetical protein